MTWHLAAVRWQHDAPTAPVASARTIRDFDLNDRAYRLTDFGDIDVTAANGEFSFTDENGLWTGSIDGIEYGDLDGDGIEEAAVHLSWVSMEGATCRCETVVVLTIRSTSLAQVGDAGGGDRSDGGILEFGIDDQMLTLLATGGAGDCKIRRTVSNASS